ncbi:MAG TPA: hypothetical protein VFI11_12410 [Anaerolineales bacterium]|nr:hypothetical protein [Anaerolineales bacterium]
MDVRWIALLVVALLSAACGKGSEATVTRAPQQPITASPTPSLPPASPTPTPPLSALAPPGVTLETLQAPPTRSRTAGEPSLASIIEADRSFLEAGATMNLLPAARTIPVVEEFTAELRATDPETRSFLSQFEASFGPEGFEARFPQEVLVREGDLELWLPIHEGLVPSVTGGLVRGQSVTLYVRLLGSLQTEPGYMIVLVITDIRE